MEFLSMLSAGKHVQGVDYFAKSIND